MVSKFPKPKEGTVFYEDDRVYACLAFDPKVEGHTIVAWKDEVEDISCLSPEDYQYLMKVVNNVRNALLQVFNTKKVYLAYLDEACHVHWHLFPRKVADKKGFDLMAQPHGKPIIFSIVPTLQSIIAAQT